MEFKQQTSSWLTIFLVVCIVHLGIFSLGFNFSPTLRLNPRPKVFVQTIQLNPGPVAFIEEIPPKKIQIETSETKVEEKPIDKKPIEENPKKEASKQQVPQIQHVKKPEIKKQETKPKPSIKKEEVKKSETPIDARKKEAERKKLEEDKRKIQQEKAKEAAKKEAEEKEKKRKAEEQAKISAKEKEIQEKLSKLKQFKTDKNKVSSEAPSQVKNLPKTIDKLQIDHLPTVEFSSTGNAGREETSYRDKVHHFLKRALILPEYGSVDVKVTLNKSGKVIKFEIIKKKSAKNASYLEKTIPALVFPIVDEKLLDGSSNYTFTILLDNG